MDVLKPERSRHDVPLEHLDYKYVHDCSDVKELEKILKVLRSGVEGTYPQLEAAAEEKLRSLNPKSRALLKDQPIFSTRDLGKEGNALADDFAQWTDDITHVDHVMKESSTGSLIDDSLPPVRGTCANIQVESKQGGQSNSAAQKAGSKRPMPRSHKEWDKVDIEAELQKIDENESETKPKATNTNVLRKPARPNIPERIDATGLTDDEKRYKAEKEKEKGNEAFRSNDYEEAALYYTRSLSLVASVPAVNNRAQAYVKLQKWSEAVEDCNTVLEHEPDNLKAHLRRSVAYKGQKQYREAKKDLQKILITEPNNKRAKDLLAEVEEALAEQKVKGRRMVIEEVSDDDSDETDDVTTSDSHTTAASDDVINETRDVTQNEKEPVRMKIEEVQETEHSTEAEGVAAENQQEETEAKAAPADEIKSEEATSESEQQQEETQESAAVRQPPPPLSPELNKLKEDGNQLFRTGSYADAITIYNNAIEKLERDEAQAENLAVLYSNRAACRTKIGDCSGCVDDCHRALVLAPHAIKPLLRRAMAYEALEKYRPAYVDYRHVLNIDSSVDIALQGSTRCQKTLAQQDGPKWREKLPPIPSFTPSTRPPQPVRQVPKPSAESAPQPKAKEVPKAEPKVSNDQLFEKMKLEGNEHVKKGNFKQAIESYTECIELCPEKTPAYTNRALCYLRLNKPGEVVADCDKALQFEPGNVKAIFRRGQANKMLGDYVASERDLELVLSLDRANTAARRELKLVQNYIAEEKAKKRKEEELASKGRRKIQIEEVESSEEESDDNREEQTSQQTHQKLDVPESKSTSEQSEVKIKLHDTEIEKGTTKVEKLTSKPKSFEISTDQIKSSMATKETGHSLTNGTKDQSSSSETKGQSSNKGTQGMGVDYDLKANKASSKIRPTAQMTKSEVKATPYEFISAWNALKNTESVEPYMTVLLQVQPDSLPKVISNKLEGDMLQKIIQCSDKLARAGEKRKAFDYMRHLTKVPRFQMNTMFMSKAEKQDVKGALERMKGDVTDKELATLGKQYGV